MGIFPKFRGEHKKYLKFHHLDEDSDNIMVVSPKKTFQLGLSKVPVGSPRLGTIPGASKELDDTLPPTSEVAAAPINLFPMDMRSDC